ncbi:MAG TPA: D-alanyl-D-alanine carboxypeptidase [Panacibacter sp.]|nr:D-alanyl-D-alanine carboxypeptidase [Panacibacter sp.]
MQKNTSIAFLVLSLWLSSCSVNRQIDKSAKKDIIERTDLSSAHVGISIYDPETKKYLYNYDGDKYFIPASNTKIITCYAAMKYLGDSLVGLDVTEFNNFIIINPTCDPTLLHPDFPNQPVIDFLQKQTKSLLYESPSWKENAYGSGWSWDDYNDDYMPERSAMPVYGNVLSLSGKAEALKAIPSMLLADLNPGYVADTTAFLSNVKRSFLSNKFNLAFKGTTEKFLQVPFITSDTLALNLLEDTLHKTIGQPGKFRSAQGGAKSYKIYSQPTDSLLKIMMHRSDNFFAEQSLLMVSNQLIGVMNDESIIDTILKSDLKDIPQKPRWADGSGLSRYNLFTPQDFVFVLNKMRNEFEWKRITTIFSTGGSGTLNARYKNLEGEIYAKTGTLSNNLALSGYVVTSKGKTLIFSMLVGNHTAAGVDIRNAMEQFLTGVIEKY